MVQSSRIHSLLHTRAACSSAMPGDGAARALARLGAVEGRERGHGRLVVEHPEVLAVVLLGDVGRADVGAGADGGAGACRAGAVGGCELLVHALDVPSVACKHAIAWCQLRLPFLVALRDTTLPADDAPSHGL